MPGGPQPHRRPLSRADLPDEFTPDTVRRLDVFAIRRLAKPGNGILDADEQRRFDQALQTVMQDTTHRLEQTLRRARLGGQGGLDPQLRRSYARTEERLAAQARQARSAFPQLMNDPQSPVDAPRDATTDPTIGPPDTLPTDATTDTRPTGPEKGVAVGPPLGRSVEPSDELSETFSDDENDDSISLGALESSIEQTSDTLEILEQIASIQRQQLEHQRTQLLRDVRGVFFAFLLSVAVIVAGVAPLVQADPDERRQIVVWTLAVCCAAGIVYALVRAAQNRRGQSEE